MKCLGMDLGTKTMGLAISDINETISLPYKVIRYRELDELIKEILSIIDVEKIEKLILGLPKNMDNSMGFASERSMNFVENFKKYSDMKIILVDERLSTKEAESILLESDTSRKKRKQTIDSYAASIILDTYLRMKGNQKNGR